MGIDWKLKPDKIVCVATKTTHFVVERFPWCRTPNQRNIHQPVTILHSYFSLFVSKFLHCGRIKKNDVICQCPVLKMGTSKVTFNTKCGLSTM